MRWLLQNAAEQIQRESKRKTLYYITWKLVWVCYKHREKLLYAER